MTLILSLAHPNFVLQVSDRMVTDLYTLKTIDDERNKAVQFCNRWAFSFTGLGELDGIPTDAWLANTLEKAPTDSFKRAMEYVGVRASEAIGRSKVSKKYKKHAFVGIGWARSDVNPEWAPVMFRISNFHDQYGQRRDLPSNDFRVQHNIYRPPKVWGWLDTGTPMHTKDLAWLKRLLGRRVPEGLGANEIVRLFLYGIRKSAARFSTVGRSAMLTVISKACANSGRVAMINPTTNVVITLDGEKTSPRQGELPVFMFYPADSETPVVYGPRFVCPFTPIAQIADFTYVEGDAARAMFPKPTLEEQKQPAS